MFFFTLIYTRREFVGPWEHNMDFTISVVVVKASPQFGFYSLRVFFFTFRSSVLVFPAFFLCRRPPFGAASHHCAFFFTDAIYNLKMSVLQRLNAFVREQH